MAYLKLTFVTILPVIFAVIFYLLDKKTKFAEINYKVKQIIYGIVFGCLAIFGTEWGIPMNGAMVNCRDAAVLVAGLMFGAPAGIIAGTVGAVERALCILWGVGEYTVVACSVSTFIAGIYAALLRKFMFDNKRPAPFIALAIGLVMEVFHLTMVFITNLDDPIRAMTVVSACTPPMLIANSLAVFAAALFINLLSRQKKEEIEIKRQTKISQTIQAWLLVVVAVAFVLTSIFVYFLQDGLADEETQSQLDVSLEEINKDVSEASDRNLLTITRKSAAEIDSWGNEITNEKISQFATDNDIAEINIVGKDGVILYSNISEFIGFNMWDYEQSSEFKCLLTDKTEFVQSYRPQALDNTKFQKYAGVVLTKEDLAFVQVGEDSVHFQNDIQEQIRILAKNRSVGKSGYLMIIDGNGQVITAPSKVLEAMASGYEEPKINVGPNEVFELEINKEKCYCMYSVVENFSIVAVLPQEEALQARNIILYVNSFMEVLVFAILFALIYLLIKKVVVVKIQDINKTLAKITKGDLNETVNVRTNIEFSKLSDDINSTVDTLKHYIEEASKRIDEELIFAKNIQSSALPSTFPAFPKRKDFDIFAYMDTAKEVGGDFYDFYMTDNNTLNFLIADVSGKGIPAAMFMMRAKTELKSLTEAGISIDRVFTNGNNALCEGNDANMFVTAWQGGIDLTTGHVKFVNAGHNPPLIKRANGKFEYLKSKVGFVLAGMDDFIYKTQEIDLNPGDVIYLYTDGVTEATNKDNELFGEERLLNALNEQEFDNVTDMCKYVNYKVNEFVADAPQMDDITMVGFKYIGTIPNPSIKFDEASLDDITAITEFVEEEFEKLDIPMKTTMQFNIAVDEIYSNIVKYAYPGKKSFANVEIIYNEDPKSIGLKFIDEGVPYNPVTKEDPDVTLSADEREIGGLGIFVVKKTMDDMKYSYENDKNILTITKYLG